MKKYYTPPIHSYILFVLVFWSLVIAGLVNWKIQHNEQTTQELAENEARANFNKDKAFRLWMTKQQRIYVPVTEDYKPSPLLKHIEGW